MTDRTLYATDLDGTLLGTDARISHFTARTLERLMDDGIYITCATGRSWVTTQRVLGDFRFRLPMVLYDGTFTYDASRNLILDQHLLSVHTTRSIIDLCQENEIPPLLYGMDSADERMSWVMGISNPGLERFFASRESDPRNAPREHWNELPTRGVFTIAATGAQAAVHSLAGQIRAQVGDGCEVTVQQETYHSHDTWMTVVPRRVSKAAALTRLARTLGINQLVVFGDNLNDLSMFEVADASYAVANAKPAVRDAATAVIRSNSEDGVARWLADNVWPVRKKLDGV